MDSVKPSTPSNISGLVRTFAKILRFRASGIAPDDGIRKVKYLQNVEVDSTVSCDDDDEKKRRNRVAMEAFIAKLFASISSVKASYAQLQIAQTPYDPDGIQSADELVVNQLKHLSELKQCYLKKQMDPSPQVTQLLAEIQEQKSLLKTYVIMGKKLESQLKLKDSEITFFREKLEESDKQNSLLEKRLNPSVSLSVLDNLHLLVLNPNHFSMFLRHTIKSIRIFTKLMIDEMESSGWDLDAAASSIEMGIVYRKHNHKCFAFESFVCREMFDGFQYPKFSLPNESLPDQKQRRRHFFDTFMELKSIKPKEFLAQKPHSTFGKFCRAKYLQLVHPKMESLFFGDLNQRNLLNSGGYPETAFFTTFAEMAKRIWLLHCLAFSFEPEASIFQVRRGCRYSEVYMESVSEIALDTPIVNLRAGFTVVPGFKIDKTIIQCQVYLSPA